MGGSGFRVRDRGLGFGFFEVRGFEFGVSTLGVSGRGFDIRAFGTRGFGVGVRGFQGWRFRVRGAGLVFRGFRGSAFRGAGFSRFGVSGCRMSVWCFEVRGVGFGVSMFGVGGGVFEVQGLGLQVVCFGYGFLRFRVSRFLGFVFGDLRF